MNVDYYSIPGCIAHPFVYLEPETENIRDYDYFEKILNQVCCFFSVDAKTVRFNKTRKREIVIARQMSMKLIHQKGKYSLATIGRFFNKDHATVLHAVKCIANLRDTDKRFKDSTNIFFN